MKPFRFGMTLMMLLNSAVALASDSVTAANSEDIGAFDQALAAQRKDSGDKKPAKDSDPAEMGSARAKDLSKQIQSDQFKNYGQSVADQRRNNNGHALATGGNSADKSTPGQGNGRSVANGASNKPKRKQSGKSSP